MIRPSIVLTLLAAAAAAVTSGPTTSRPPKLAASAAKGPVAIAGSPSGVAVVTAAATKPGATVTGRVTITNTGNVDSDVGLVVSTVSEVPGRWGGRLSAGLDLELVDVTGTPRPLYRGAPAGLRTLALGTWRRDERHVYELTLRFPDGGPPASPRLGDNLLQGASLRFDLTWEAGKATGGGNGRA